MWSGEISGSGLPANLGVGIFGCEGGDEMDVIIRTSLNSAILNNQSLHSQTTKENSQLLSVTPFQYRPSGTCLGIATDPDNNPDTDDGPGAILCSKKYATAP